MDPIKNPNLLTVLCMKRPFYRIFPIFILLLAALSCVKDSREEPLPIGGLSPTDAQFYFEEFLAADFREPYASGPGARIGATSSRNSR